MTYAELNNNFQTLYDSKASLAAPGYTDNEIDIFLNKAQEIIVEELYNNKQWWFLRDITTSTTLTPAQISSSIDEMFNNEDDTTNDFARIVTISISSLTTFLYHKNLTVSMYRTDLPEITFDNSVKQDTELIDEININKYKTTGDNYPIFREPKIFYQGSTGIIVGDYYSRISYDSANAVLSYITKPTAIANGTSTTSPLDPQTHKGIVEKAVELALLATDTGKAPVTIQSNDKVNTL